MPLRTLVRGDDYIIRRQIFVLELADDTLAPFNMAGCTIRVTFKPSAVPPADDPVDATAPFKGNITFDLGGVVTASSNLKLPTGGSASDGVLWVTANRTTTLALPLGGPLGSDVEIVDANGEYLTIFSSWTTETVDGYTNRTSG